MLGDLNTSSLIFTTVTKCKHYTGNVHTWKLLNNLPMASQLRSKANHLYKVFILIKTTFLLLKEYRVQNKFAKNLA